MPGRVVRVLVRRRRGRRPPAGRRRRSDEDGERAALAEGRPRQGRAVAAARRSRPAACWSSSNSTCPPDDRRTPTSHRHTGGRTGAVGGARSAPNRPVADGAPAQSASARAAVALAVVAAIVAAAIVTLFTVDLGPVAARARRARGLEVHRAADAHRQAVGEAHARRVRRRGPRHRGLKPTDRPFLTAKKIRRRPVVDGLQPEADRSSRST